MWILVMCEMLGGLGQRNLERSPAASVWERQLSGRICRLSCPAQAARPRTWRLRGPISAQENRKSYMEAILSANRRGCLGEKERGRETSREGGKEVHPCGQSILSVIKRVPGPLCPLSSLRSVYLQMETRRQNTAFSIVIGRLVGFLTQ